MNIYKEKRKEIGLTQKEMANKLYVRQATISKWETGKSVPDQKILPDVANILNTTIDELLKPKEKNTQQKINKYITPEQNDWINLFNELNKKYGKDFTNNITEALWKLIETNEKGEN